MLETLIAGRRLGPAVAAGLLSACATLPPDGGMAPVSALVRERAAIDVRAVHGDEDRADVERLIAERLQRPLTADDAVQIAVLSNPALQASYAEVGIAEAEFVRAGRLPNPRFSFSRLANSASVEIERKFVVDVVAILAMPLTLRLEDERRKAAQTRAAAEVMDVAARTRNAYLVAVAAAESARYFEQVVTAAEVRATLAQRMAAAGNWSALAHTREQLFQADAAAQLARTRHAALAARERLARLMGLGGQAQAIRLPERLPDVPAAPRALADAETAALSQRLDVLLARQAFESTARALDLTRATRFVGVFHAAYQNKNETGDPRKNGYEIEVEVPLFDWGDARVAKADAIYRQAASRLAETVDAARSEVRTAHDAYRTTHELARRYRGEIVPLRNRIAEENLLRYNGMLISVFELLADAREQVVAVNAALEATRDFWLADADLEVALVAGTPALASVSPMRSAATADAAQSH
jgi:outer membrane protein TolC